MAEYRLAPLARQDMKAILSYIYSHNPSASRKMSMDFFEAFEKLAYMPLMGYRRDFHNDQNLRFWPVGMYIIVYKPGAAPLEIVRILHSSRNIPDIL